MVLVKVLDKYLNETVDQQVLLVYAVGVVAAVCWHFVMAVERFSCFVNPYCSGKEDCRLGPTLFSSVFLVR